MNAPSDSERTGWIAVDGGSTRTRAWLLQGEQVLARAVAPCGARDAARVGNGEPLRAALRGLFAELSAARADVSPQFIAAAGMVTSALGLAEVPHVPAPASLRELAARARRMMFPDVGEAPFWLFPGVRCGGPESREVGETDVMRGEETLCAGLLASEKARPPFALLHLGSHWKWIELDAAGRIAFCRTTLSGELLYAARTNTVLATALPDSPPGALDPDWCERGMTEARRAGLPRALFCARLLELQGRANAAERLAFVLGALVAADEGVLTSSAQLPPAAPVFVEGWSAAVAAWRQALRAAGRRVIELTEAERDAAFLAGLRALVQRARV